MRTGIESDGPPAVTRTRGRGVKNVSAHTIDHRQRRDRGCVHVMRRLINGNAKAARVRDRLGHGLCRQIDERQGSVRRRYEQAADPLVKDAHRGRRGKRDRFQAARVGRTGRERRVDDREESGIVRPTVCVRDVDATI